MKFPAAEAISRIDSPLNWTPEKDSLFVAACREMAAFHYENSPDLRFIYDRRGFKSDDLQSVDDLQRLPSVGVQAMKYHLLTSLSHEQAILKLTSSGTRGQKTQIWFDEASLARVQAMLDGLWTEMGLVSSEPTNYLMMIYDPKDAQDLGIAFSIRNQQRFAPVGREFFALQKNACGAWEFKIEQTVARLREYASEGRPVRICGIPSFIHELAEKIAEPVRLPPASFIFTGGGWKAAEDKRIPKEQFRATLSEKLGIPQDHIRDGYGMAEHSAPYMECDHHRFHVPVFCRILVRDPASMKVLPPGEIGLFELVTPFNAMMPNLSVLSTDLGSMDTQPCTCGRTSPTFTLVGRGGLMKHKGCAITAAEIAKKGK